MPRTSTGGYRSKVVRKIFLNVPYSDEYSKEILPAVVTVCWGYGLKPFLLKDDLNRPRLARLFQHIKNSALMITDLSRPDRMNMPLEAGMALAFDVPCAFLVDDERARKRNISDLYGIDFLEHRNDAEVAIKLVSKWLKQQLGSNKCSVPDTSLRFVFKANKAFLTTRGNADLDLDAARRAARKLYQKWGVDDIAEFSDAAGEAPQLDPMLVQRHAAL